MADLKDKAKLDKKIEEMFKKFDFDKNNAIDEGELAKALEMINPQIEKDVIHQAFLSLDLDKNKTLSLEEFKNFVYKTLMTK